MNPPRGVRRGDVWHAAKARNGQSSDESAAQPADESVERSRFLGPFRVQAAVVASVVLNPSLLIIRCFLRKVGANWRANPFASGRRLCAPGFCPYSRGGGVKQACLGRQPLVPHLLPCPDFDTSVTILEDAESHHRRKLNRMQFDSAMTDNSRQSGDTPRRILAVVTTGGFTHAGEY
jgi:hypothetical protein